MQTALPIAPLNMPISVPLDQRVANARSALERNLPRFARRENVGLGMLGVAALISGGPRVADWVHKIRTFDVTFACGSVYGYLLAKGIVPTYCVVFDPGEDHAKFYREPHPLTRFLVSSTCHPSVFDALAGSAVELWHPADDIYSAVFNFETRIGGGSSVTLRAIALAHVLGFREQHMFGFDCCFDGGDEHAYPHDQDRPPPPIDALLDGRRFLTTPALLQQAQEFFRMYYDHQHHLSVTLYGDGLARAMFSAGARHDA